MLQPRIALLLLCVLVLLILRLYVKKIPEPDLINLEVECLKVTALASQLPKGLSGKQFIGYYGRDSRIIVGYRTLSPLSSWQWQAEPYRAMTEDAHKSISLMVDGVGTVHLVWDLHATDLRYIKSLKSGSKLKFESSIMIGDHLERLATYPEFYRFSNGSLLFLYRHGVSGDGQLVLNHYNTQKRSWTRVQDRILWGEGKESPYWQTFLDHRDQLHVSWMWRESGRVETNHDMAYAVSSDGGKTWKDSQGKAYQLPITLSTAEYVARIPQNSGLMNQGSMTVDRDGTVYISTYWNAPGTSVPQIWIIYSTTKGAKWKQFQVTSRTAPHSFRGAGTKRTPLSRPQILADSKAAGHVYVIFRDSDHFKNGCGVASCYLNTEKPSCEFHLILGEDLGQWEPTYDTELWRTERTLHLFVQYVNQLDGQDERGDLESDTIAATPVWVLEVDLTALVKGISGAVRAQ